jgi:hypothetical protein
MDAHFNVIKNVKFLLIIIDQKESFKVIQVFSNVIHIDLSFSDYSFHNWDRVVQLLPSFKFFLLERFAE